ncbi:MAG: SGNH/GDSL hydrolase family protein [Clostridia bacterium]|nr:SGNH/GDSL hydrolase family protein [Clostridia bacterium]
MHIKDKIYMEREGLEKYGPITIVAFGDSVTHGAVADGEIDYESVYWNRLRKKILDVRNYVPVNVINAGIGGITAAGSIERMDRQVLAHSPDLVIVCFGLNDVNGELEEYIGALKTIFKKCQEIDTDVIFMTPNMLNTYVAEDTAPVHREYAATTAEYQNSGRMDMFMNSACELARQMNVAVCDCYSMWKKRSETEDTTMLLANRINHPTREMHQLFADSLFDIIIGNAEEKELDSDTMFKK